ncbi:MAG TPA: hypothetical protein PKE55_09420 [Kiritimatiellia bacterium]|nr:hypothetical protein [Kiritimatiellia bacterium]
MDLFVGQDAFERGHEDRFSYAGSSFFDCGEDFLIANRSHFPGIRQVIGSGPESPSGGSIAATGLAMAANTILTVDDRSAFSVAGEGEGFRGFLFGFRAGGEVGGEKQGESDDQGCFERKSMHEGKEISFGYGDFPVNPL